ncbi:dipeptidase [Paracoccus sp. (in: a-proteobacteria)]|uniref:dipeptidase n=1 Tax=Paracoccus sp. TaxID=267 RepID=UPI0026E0B304|nr:dipeptidase [Paracoccus sp. (in: a-proteobacteria)]MDO5646807.1 dipeptidase [Paracoccus sp. (in: a-proteobacteria)]
MIPVFDGHNDFLQRAAAQGPHVWTHGDGLGHLDLPRAQAGGFVGGFFAIWVPSPASDDDAAHMALMQNPPYAVPLPDPVDHADALPPAFAQAAALMAMERTGTVDISRNINDLRATIDAGRIAAIMHMEGVEAIRDPDALHVWHAMGLRSLGPVWSRPTAFGHGVPFAFPASPDTGPGLTDLGRALIRECNALRIMIDLSHLNEAGFNDVATLSDAPLVASHSAVHAICPSTRNLTDRQLQVIADSGGLVGLNFATSFLRADGQRMPFPGFDPMLRHLDHMLAILGEDGVAVGSDFDGALMPADLADVSALPALIAAMQAHGYGDALIRKIACDNWIGLLARTWG